MANAVRVVQAFVLDDASPRLLDALQDGSERPRPQVDHGIFDPRFVLERVGAG